MGDVLKMLNADLGLKESTNQWLPDGEALVLGEGHQLSVHLLPDGCAVFLEFKVNTRPRLFEIRDGFWLKLAVGGGFVQFMPKTIGSNGVLLQCL